MRHLLLLVPLVFLATCSPEAEAPTPCDGFAKRTGILGSEYRDCARAIMAQLDTLERRLGRAVKGDTMSGADARTSYRQVRRLIRQTGVERDTRSGSNARQVQRWPQAIVRSFNQSATSAISQWGSAVRRPNAANYGEGKRHYQNARRLYGQVW
jgi:hypothetical protein